MGINRFEYSMDTDVFVHQIEKAIDAYRALSQIAISNRAMSEVLQVLQTRCRDFAGHLDTLKEKA